MAIFGYLILIEKKQTTKTTLAVACARGVTEQRGGCASEGNRKQQNKNITPDFV
jgi:hypothetical protein